MSLSWTKPYEGISHYGYDKRGVHNVRWATVTQWTGWVELHLNLHGTFECEKLCVDTMEEAKKIGENWVNNGVAMKATA